MVTPEGLALFGGRLAFGLVLAVMGLNHFQQTDALAGYAEAKGVPAPRVGVLASGVVLVAGGVGVAIGLFPTVAALALAGFLVLSAVLFHDFWAVGEEQRQDELTAFLKNVAMAGAALAIAAVGTPGWALGVGVGLL